MKKFTLIFPARARKRKSVLSAIVSFVILVFTINCAMNLGANASFELPNNDPSKNTSSQSPEERTLRKDLNLIDLVDCLDASSEAETPHSDGELSQQQENASPETEIPYSYDQPALRPYRQSELDSSGSDECFDADGYPRSLANMPDISPPHYSLFLGKS